MEMTGDKMQDIADVLTGFFKSRDKGLGVLELPTGLGKTYSCAQAVKRYIRDCKAAGKTPKKFIYIAPQHDQMPGDVFFSIFEDEDQDESSKNYDCLVLKKNLDGVLENYLDLYDHSGKTGMPGPFKARKECKELASEIRLYNRLSGRGSSKTPAEPLASKEDIKRIETGLREIYEPAFRTALRAYIRGTKDLREKITEIKDAHKDDLGAAMREIRDLPECAWVFRLYPGIDESAYAARLMTVKKFLVPFDSIFCGNYMFTGSNTLKDRILIIDEQDVSYMNVLDHLADTTSKLANDSLTLFKEIRKALIKDRDTKVLDNLPEAMKDAIDEFDADHQRFDKLLAKANRIYDDYRLQFEYRTDEAEGDGERNFIFNDNLSSINVYSNEGHTHVFAEFDEPKNRVTVKTVTPRQYKKITGDPKREIIQLLDLLKAVRRFFSETGSYLNDFAEQYSACKNKANLEDRELFKKPLAGDLISIDNAVNTVLYTLLLKDIIKPDFLRQINPTSLRRDSLFSVIRDLSFYACGFSVFQFMNSPDHAESTTFEYTSLRVTPEALIYSIAQSCPVLMVSATATWDSGRNFCLPWLKEKLGKDYIDLSAQAREYEEAFYAGMRNKYAQIDIRTDFLSGAGILGNSTAAEALRSWFPNRPDLDGRITALCKMIDEDQNRCNERLKKNRKSKTVNDPLFITKRYLELFAAIRAFYESKNSRAWFFLTAPLLKKDSDKAPGFRFEIAEAFKHLCDKAYPDIPRGAPSMHVLNAQNFTEENKQFKDELLEGKNVLVFSAYNSTALGVNIHFELPKEVLESECICVAPFENRDDGRLKSCDFDGLYLGNITNIYDRPNDESESAEEQKQAAVKCIYDLENQVEHNVMPFANAKKYIRDVLCGAPFFYNEFDAHNLMLRRRKAATVIQAIGRISRVFYKNKTITLLLSQEIAADLDPIEMESHFLTPEQQQIAELVRPLYQPHPDEQEQMLRNAAEQNSTMTARNIAQILGIGFSETGWDRTLMDLWEGMREFALRHPTCEALPEKNTLLSKLLKHAYFDGSGHADYFYLTPNNFEHVFVRFVASKDLFRAEENIKKYFDDPGPYQMSGQVNAKSARLEALLRYPGMAEHFKKNGYAQSFGTGRLLMTPAFFNNIYKGALGETAGRFILKSLGIGLEPISDGRIFELFDFTVKGKPEIFVDFKDWSSRTRADDASNRLKVREKLEKTGGRAFIINVVLDSASNAGCNLSADRKIITIPGLIDEQGSLIEDNVKFLREELAYADQD